MYPLNNNPHLIEKFAHDRYNDRRREADAWRLAKIARAGVQEACASAGSRLERVKNALRRQLMNAPQQQAQGC
ncbi:MAG: hypothetical protein ACOC9Z_03505 [Chloroflexota bacterium]